MSARRVLYRADTGRDRRIHAIAIQRDDPPTGKIERLRNGFCSILMDVPSRNDPVAGLVGRFHFLLTRAADGPCTDMDKIMDAGVVPDAPHRAGEKPSRRPFISSRKSIWASIWSTLISSWPWKGAISIGGTESMPPITTGTTRT